jgi:tetratricopeptide (TPR) repeat protein
MNSIEELLKIADAFLWNQDFDRAIEFYSSVIIYDENIAEAYEGRGAAYSAKGMYNDAIADLSRAIYLNPESFNAYYSKGMAFHNLNDLKSAKSNYEMAVHHNDGAIEALLNLAFVSLVLKDYEDCLIYSGKLLEFDREDKDALWYSGDSHSELGNHAKAIEYYKRALKLDPKNSDLYNNIGFQMSFIGEYKEAIRYFNTALHYRPNSPYPLDNRGYCHFKLGEEEAALEDINESLKIDPSNSYGYKNRALVYLHQNEREAALKDLRKAKLLGYTEKYGSEVDDLLASEFDLK